MPRFHRAAEAAELDAECFGKLETDGGAQRAADGDDGEDVGLEAALTSSVPAAAAERRLAGIGWGRFGCRCG
jgi:hypothetical protein